ncbi:MAG TPA: methyltransferase domain-containing protein [Pyrinomonadaceae bacterium]|jgi:2-polyprenyl-3-methyl-5-hydroxy-6-metoxy-1,4-benzoquinol methylase|nr:methyltransferase domain-containing protein [Pyrinomonadaceae bacterium]
MATPTYTEFEWHAADAGNGASGEKLTQVFINLVKRLDGVRSICDLGCGNGHISGRLAALGYHVIGVDASASGIQIAQGAYPAVEFVHALIDRDLNLGQFDLVISSDVIEHLYRPSDLLEAVVKQLKPGGQILLGTPYHGYLKNLILAATGKMDAHYSALHDGGHIKFFSVNTLSKLMRAHGFDDLSFTFYGRAPWLWKNMICHARK